MHSEMWWERLFKSHSAIAWDDYEKDYSDLPPEVLEKHRIQEAIGEEAKQLDYKERLCREALQVIRIGHLFPLWQPHIGSSFQ
jgi:hypothetical protein